MKKNLLSLVAIFLTLMSFGCASDKNKNENSDENNIPIEQPDHDHVYQKVLLEEPTCTKDGMYTYVCEICLKTQANTKITALGHEYETIITKKATCLEEGSQEEQCKRCGNIINKTTISCISHSLYMEEWLKDGQLMINYRCSVSPDFNLYNIINYPLEEGRYDRASGLIVDVIGMEVSYIILKDKYTVNGEYMYKFAIIKFINSNLPYDNTHLFDTSEMSFEEKKTYYTKTHCNGTLEKEVEFKIVNQEIIILKQIG